MVYGVNVGSQRRQSTEEDDLYWQLAATNQVVRAINKQVEAQIETNAYLRRIADALEIRGA